MNGVSAYTVAGRRVPGFHAPEAEFVVVVLLKTVQSLFQNVLDVILVCKANGSGDTAKRHKESVAVVSEVTSKKT